MMLCAFWDASDNGRDEAGMSGVVIVHSKTQGSDESPIPTLVGSSV